MTSVDAERPFVIYGIYSKSDPEQKVRYVGQTCRGLRKRWADHQYSARIGLTGALYNWMRKHGDDAGCRVLEEHDSEESLDEAEIRLIRELRTFRDEGGLNLTRGGTWSNGATQRGSDNAYSRLREDQVHEIVEYLNVGISQEDIAAEYGVTRNCIASISRGDSWRHVTEGVLQPGQARIPRGGVSRASRLGNAVLDAEKVHEIKRDYDPSAGVTTYSLAERYGVSSSTIQAVVDGTTWVDVMPDYVRPKYENRPNAFLDASAVADIKLRLAGGKRGIGAQLAREYGVSQMTISDIKRGATWTDVAVDDIISK